VRSEHHAGRRAAPAAAASGGLLGLPKLSFGKGHLAVFGPATLLSAESGGLPADFGPMRCDAATETGRKPHLPDLVSENGSQYGSGAGDDCVSAGWAWAHFAQVGPIGMVGAREPPPAAAPPTIARGHTGAAPCQPGGAVDLRALDPHTRSGPGPRRAPPRAPSMTGAARPAADNRADLGAGAPAVRR
jgi:hypothetical protein